MKYTKEQLEKWVKESSYMKDLLIKMYGSKIHGSYYPRVKTKIKQWKIDTSHWVTPKSSFSKESKLTKEKVFCYSKTRVSGTILRQWMKKEGIEYKCQNCSIDSWDKKTITLQVDHIDGNKLNNKIDNLRFLCPNCHSQTPTFCGRQNKKTYKCINCNKQIKSKNNKYCKPCSYLCRRKPSENIMPDKINLSELLRNHRIIEVAHHFGVDQRTVIDWCKILEIDWPVHKNGFWLSIENRKKMSCMICQKSVYNCKCFDGIKFIGNDDEDI